MHLGEEKNGQDGKGWKKNGIIKYRPQFGGIKLVSYIFIYTYTFQDIHVCVVWVGIMTAGKLL